MFFSDDLLTSKKGSFGVIWLAATLGPRNRRITRKQLTAIDLSRTCELIAEPPEPMALRLSGCLLVGVARVYNQNYEIFYSDVDQFHSTLRRSIATDFSTAIGGGVGGIGGLDIPGGGKSKLDQITFGGVDFGWDSAFSFDFNFIDWKTPVGDSRKRRSSSKLSSLPSQKQTEDASSEESEGESEDEEEPGVARGGKRRKFTSSPHVAPMHQTNLPRTSVYHPSDSTGGNFFPDMNFPIDQPIDLNLELPEDVSISDLSNRGFELPEDGGMMKNGVGGDIFPTDLVPTGGDQAQTPGAAGLAGAYRKPSREGSSEGSPKDVEEDLEKKKKPKKVKKLAFDENLEIPDNAFDDIARNYAVTMAREKRDLEAKEQRKTIANQATAMVDGGGDWPQFFDPDMKAFFATISKAGTFQWERDVAANRAGTRWSPERPQQQDARVGFEDPFAFDQGVQGYQEPYQDFEIPIHDTSRRTGNEDIETERGRSSGQGSQQAPLPWDDRSFGLGDTDHGFPDVADSSFTPGSRKLSLLTPQEIRIRLNRGPGSLSGTGSMRRTGRGRSRSGSIFDGRAEDAARMLIGDDDEELPLDYYDLDSLPPSQMERRADLPEAFQPAMLATLEKQCRDFFSYVENHMNEAGIQILDLDDLAPLGKTKRVAALAFYNCLTLATKGILSVTQPEPWGMIVLRFTVEA